MSRNWTSAADLGMQNFSLRSSCIWCLCAFISAASPSITIAGSRTPLRFEIVPLGALPGGMSSDPEAINNRGDIVGRSETDRGLRPFLYRNGTMTELPIGDREQYGYAVDINDSGDIIARAFVNFRSTVFSCGAVAVLISTSKLGWNLMSSVSIIAE